MKRFSVLILLQFFSVLLLPQVHATTIFDDIEVEDTITLDSATASRACEIDASKQINSSSVTAIELGYLSGVTSSIQTQLDGKQPLLTGTPNALTYFDGSGNPASLNSWLVNSSSGIEGNNTITTPPDAGDIYPSGLKNYVEVSTPVATTQTHVEGAHFEVNVDSAVTSNNMSDVTGMVLLKGLRGNGLINSSTLLSLTDNIGDGTNTGSLNNSNTLNINAGVNANYTAGDVNLINGNMNLNGNVTDRLTLLNLFAGSGGGITDSFAGANIGAQIPVTSNSIILNVNSNNTVGGQLNMIGSYSDNTVTGNMFNYDSSATSPIGGDHFFYNGYQNSTTAGYFNAVSIGNDGAVTNSAKGATGFNYGQNGDVAGNFNGASVSVNGNLGSGTGQNVNGYIIGFNDSTKTMAANVTGFNIYNQMAITGNNNFAGLQVGNTSTATGYRWMGAGLFNNANQSEEIAGLRINSQNANARSITGMDISMSGVGVDDVQGMRVNINNLSTTSTSNHPRSGDFQGGTFGIQSAYTPFSSTTVEVGNNFTMTSTILSGFPLTGSDQIIQLLQSNLLVQDDISTGPFGLDTNMVGMVSQIGVDSGKTVPLMRSLLLGTSVPTGSGGTISKHVVLELLGLPSFGGAVSNPLRIGIQDSNLLGQNFCDGATDCWFLFNQDSNASNFMYNMAIATTTKKVSAPTVGLEVEGKDILVTSAGKVSAEGGAQLATHGAQPTCDVDHRGLLWNIEGAAGVADILQICQKNVLDVYVWITK